MHGMSLMAPARPDTFIRRPNRVQNLRGWTPARGKDSAMKAPHPVRWSHNTRTALRRLRCGSRDRQTRDTEYPGECRRSHISFPCVPPWLGQIRVSYLSEPPRLTLLVKSQIYRKQLGHAIFETQKDRDLAPVKRVLATVEILLPRLNQQSQRYRGLHPMEHTA